MTNWGAKGPITLSGDVTVFFGIDSAVMKITAVSRRSERFAYGLADGCIR